MDKPAILSNPEAFVVVPVHGTTTMHEAWYRARDTIVGGYYADKGPYEALLDARPDQTALADIVAYCAALEAEREDAFAAGMSYGQSVMPKGTFVTIDSDEMALLRRRKAELESERDAAYRKGAEDMRERAMITVSQLFYPTADNAGARAATAIRKLEPTP